MASDNLVIIEAFLKEFGTGSLDAAFSMLADDARWAIVQTVRGTTMTMSELRPRLEAMRASMRGNNLHLKVVGVVDGGDTLSIELESFGKTCLDQVYENRYCLIFGMSGGKIANVREYNDSLHVTHVLLPAVAHVMGEGG